MNGEQRQSSPTAGMVFNVHQIVAFWSNGSTLHKGTVIMTGTPSEIESRMVPPSWLQDGDVVKVSVPRIRNIENKLVSF